MMQRQKSKGNQYTVKTAQRQAFLQVFNLHAKEGRVSQVELKAIFERVGYFISEQHFSDICSKAFEFNLWKSSGFEILPIVLSISKMPFGCQLGNKTNSQLFRKAGVQKQRVQDLLTVLSDFVDQKNKVFNYRQFLRSLT